MVRLRRTLGAVALVGLALAVVPTTGASAAAKPKSGGTLTYLAYFASADLDPIHMGIGNVDQDGVVAQAIYDGLLTFPYGGGKTDPRQAEKLSTTDGLNWTLTLKPKLKFSDGTPFDAAAVQFNWQRCQDPANACRALTTAARIASITVANPPR